MTTRYDSRRGLLTPAQMRVLLVFCSGDHTLPEAARMLGMAEKTVKTHLTGIHRKMGVRSRAGMVAEAYQRGVAVGRFGWNDEKAPPAPKG
jgi:DNA-binding CsgD family transcriptional regulator